MSRPTESNETKFGKDIISIKAEINDLNCAYPSCNNKEGLSKCKYCQETFCKEHLEPKVPQTKILPGGANYIRSEKIRKMWRRPGGHTCVQYIPFFEEEIRKSLDRRVICTVAYVLLSFILILIIVSINNKTCTDGTGYHSCSDEKPLYCSNGTLVNNSTLCGCPYDYDIDENFGCKKIQRCSDQTIYGECSLDIPLFCLEGNLVNRSSECGCPVDYVVDVESCVWRYNLGKKEITLTYTLRGESGRINYSVYEGLSDYLHSLPREIYYSEGQSPPSTRDFVLRDLNDEKQETYLSPLASQIEDLSSNKDDQARIAISAVQNIPYNKFWVSLFDSRYPYEVLYNERGVCQEKSELLAYLLRKLGYGVVLFSFEKEDHMAVGIKCPAQYSYLNSGYCFIESTTPAIITYSEGDYVVVGKLNSTPEIISVSEGLSFDGVSEEYQDVQRLNELDQNFENSFNTSNYDDRKDLLDEQGLILEKYGIN